MELSKRLTAVASLVTEGASVADIGTDHGYIAIHLIQEGIAQKVIAMDVNEGPRKRAKEHIRQLGLADKIETRLSDGFEALEVGEVDTVITAGMGGGLVKYILTTEPEKTEAIQHFILQPQSEIEKLRLFLNREGFVSVAEDMVEEDGKYYPMMRMEHGVEEPFSEIECRYGRKLLQMKHPVLREFLLREKQMKEEIIEKLKLQSGERIAKRMAQIEEDIRFNQEALEKF